MKKGILKFLAGTTAIAVLTGGMAVSALAAEAKPEEVTEVTKMESSYYQGLQGKDGPLSGAPSLKIEKYKNGDPSQGIEGVEFKYEKVGDLYQIVNGNEVSMAFGVEADFAEEFGIKDAADYHSNGSGGELYYYKDIGTVNTQYLQKMNAQSAQGTLKTYMENMKSVETGEKGVAVIPGAEYGLYVLIEWDTSKATINEDPVSLTNTQSPFLVALPTTAKKGNTTYWEKDVTARIKNSSEEAEVEKKIVTDKEAFTDGTETTDDTDITSIGDTVHFRLKGTVPNIPDVDNANKQKINKYVLVDNLSKGLTPEMEEDGVQLKIVDVRTTSEKYTLTGEDYTTKDNLILTGKDYTTTVTDYSGNDEYKGGKTITITLTEKGLEKISDWAADESEAEPKEIYFYYTATVNEDAVIGPNEITAGTPAGNPNEVKLQYKIGTSKEMETEWDKVTEYTFGIKAEKRLAGSAQAVTAQNKESITFALYSTADNKAETKTRIYYEVEKTEDGVYHVTSVTAGTAAEKTQMHPAAGGALNIHGLEEGTYFLEELTTVSGYNLLKEPVKIEITADKGNNNYVKTNPQYNGKITQTSNTGGIFKVAINNIKGFELPSTGGNGIWIFVLAGVLVVAAGCGYYSLTVRKNRSR